MQTTLLNALSNRTPYADVTGDIVYGGRAMTTSDLMYVPQFDEVNGKLSPQHRMLVQPVATQQATLRSKRRCTLWAR
jgi:hypothetical protein